MNVTVLVLKATHYRTTVQDSPPGWASEETIRGRGEEKLWRFDVNVLVRNISENNLIMIKQAYLTGKGICEVAMAESGKVLIKAEITKPFDMGCYYYKFLGLPDFGGFAPGSEIEMELSFGFSLNQIHMQNYIPQIVNDWDEIFKSVIPLTLTIYVERMDSGPIRVRTYKEEATTNFISYPKT